MSNTSLRIHPAIGFARVGNSTEYYLAPESLAGIPQDGIETTGGLPLRMDKTGTAGDVTITNKDIRCKEGKLKRQAARFKIYQYQEDSYSYPSKSSSEVIIGSKVDGKVVKDIVWTVHLANKKANCWTISDDKGIGIYSDNSYATDPTLLRNSKEFGTDPASPKRIKDLTIDAGPQAVKGTENNPRRFKKGNSCTYADDNGNILTTHYKTNYPASNPTTPVDANEPSQPITYLGEIETDGVGRLIVVGGHGLACNFDANGKYQKLQHDLKHDVDNDNWLDDASDGPVNAVLVFEDGTTRVLENTAWVTATDPSYAPQTANAISLWDELFNAWVQGKETNLLPNLYDPTSKKFSDDFQPSFKDEVFTIFNAAHMQMWNTALNPTAFTGHSMMRRLSENPFRSANKLYYDVLKVLRTPSHFLKHGEKSEDSQGAPLMPLALGDAATSFLIVTDTQYQFVKLWQEGKCIGAPRLGLTAGEFLDKASLFNCLGGRFSPGIDMTFIIRDLALYDTKNWTNPNIGPFRMNAKKIDYATTSPTELNIGVGYIPTNPKKDANLVEPGDICKFMAIPWHTDYNSCSTHLPDPNPNSKKSYLSNNEAWNLNRFNPTPNTTMYWSWPAQRPVSVYTYDDLKANNGKFWEKGGINPALTQRFSVRGAGTKSDGVTGHSGLEDAYDSPSMQVGRFQQKKNMVLHWHEIGVVMQSTQIEDFPYEDKDIYLEVQSQFEHDESNMVEPFPTLATDDVKPPK